MCQTTDKIELTFSEKIKIATSYYGNSVFLYLEDYKTPRFHDAIDYNIISDIIGKEILFQLYLKDIEDISEEHAVHIGKLSGNEVDRYNNTDLLLIMKAKKLLSGVDRHTPNSCLANWAEIVDYLKENGYAVPYKGQSLFDLGIAIKKEIIKL